MMKFHFSHPVKDSGLSCRAWPLRFVFRSTGECTSVLFSGTRRTYEGCESTISLDQSQDYGRWQVSRCERHCNMLNCNFEQVK